MLSSRSAVVVLAASLAFAAGCTASEKSIEAAAPSASTALPTLTVIAAPAFHIGAPGDIHYEVTGVSALSSLAYTSTDGAIELGGTIEPAPAIGTLHLTYTHRGTFAVVLTATPVADGIPMRVSIAVNVVE